MKAAAVAERSLLLAATGLAGLGAVMVYSATAPLAEGALPPQFLRHAAALALGAALALAAARIPLRGWHALALPAWGLAVAALLATALFGVRVNGAQRWLALPGLPPVQPGEFAKLASVLAVAAVAARHDDRRGLAPRRVAATFGLAALPAGLLVLQPDLGNALLLLALAALVLFAAGARVAQLALPAVLAGLGAAAYIVVQPYAWRRWIGFLDPWETARAQGFQLVQSFVAFARGGASGVGFGYGRQKLHYLPEAHTDFILAVVAEELGLIGVGLVLIGFAALLWAGIGIALQARRRFPALLAFGMTLVVTLPALLNAAVVMGMLPTKGLTLPLLSYGRTSLLTTCVALGALLGVARQGSARAAPTPIAPRGRRGGSR